MMKNNKLQKKIPTGWKFEQMIHLVTSIVSGKSDTKSESGVFPIYGSTGIIGHKEKSDYSGNKIKNDLHKLVFGSGQPLITGGHFKKINLLLPPLPEQNRIVAVLEVWDGAIEKLVEKIEIKKRIKKGIASQILNCELSIINGKKIQAPKLRLPGFSGEWETVKLGDVCNIKKGKQLNKDDMIINGKYPALNGGIGASGYTNEWNTKENTITISEGGNSCGYLNFNKEKFWCGGHCYAVNPKKNIDNLYLYQFLKVKQSKIMCLRVGSGLPNIQKKALDNLILEIPKTQKEQTAIAEILTTADLEIEALEKRKKIIEDQKKYLLNNLITGKIRV